MVFRGPVHQARKKHVSASFFLYFVSAIRKGGGEAVAEWSLWGRGVLDTKDQVPPGTAD